MANLFTTISRSAIKMLSVVDGVSEMALNITDAGVAGTEVLKEAVEGYRDTERALIAANMEIIQQKMNQLKEEGKLLTRDNLDAIEL